jgi:hypothetical protein
VKKYLEGRISMTINQLMELTGKQPLWLPFVIMAIPPILTFFASLFHGDEEGNEWPWKYLYSLIIFSVFIPGIFSVALVGYAMFFIAENLLDMNIFFIIAPVVSMMLTVQIMKWNCVSIEKLPGFQRLMGLILLAGSAAVGALIISRTRFYVLSSISDMAYLMLGLFGIMYIGYYLVFCRDDARV